MEKDIKKDTLIIGEEETENKNPKVKNNCKTFKKRLFRSVILFVVGAVVAFVIGAIISYISESRAAKELRSKLMRDWESVEETEGVSLVWVLDFSEDKVQYKAETGYSELDKTLAEYDYKITGRNRFSINRFGKEWEPINVYFSDDGTVMFMSPSFTDGESAAVWFNYYGVEKSSEDTAK